MAEESKSLTERLKARFESAVAVRDGIDMVELEVAPEVWMDVARALRDEPGFRFEQLSDLAGVDYLGYGQSEWEVSDVSSEGFSRGVEGTGPGRFRWEEGPGVAAPEQGRFAVVVHLLSYHYNQRLRLSCRCPDGPVPVVASLVEVWPGANWFEREAFDLFGIVFEGHPDLRRLLTDYGFVGHPFRKDFPLIGNVEVRYDPDKGRVVYQPVSIEPRVGVPRVVRDDSRYLQAKAEQQSRDSQG